eukprot:scpid88139/ scgid21461/ 
MSSQMNLQRDVPSSNTTTSTTSSRHSKPKLPPFTRGENPTHPSPGPPSPVSNNVRASTAAEQPHGHDLISSKASAAAATVESFSGATTVGGLPHLAPLPNLVATGAVVHGVAGASSADQQRKPPYQQQQRAKSLDSPPMTARQPQHQQQQQQ